MGWSDLKNGDLIATAESAGFLDLITSDKNLRYQQNLTGRKISIITLNALFVDLAGIAPLAPQVIEALEDLSEGAFVVISP